MISSCWLQSKSLHVPWSIEGIEQVIHKDISKKDSTWAETGREMYFKKVKIGEMRAIAEACPESVEWRSIKCDRSDLNLAREKERKRKKGKNDASRGRKVLREKASLSW